MKTMYVVTIINNNEAEPTTVTFDNIASAIACRDWYRDKVDHAYLDPSGLYSTFTETDDDKPHEERYTRAERLKLLKEQCNDLDPDESRDLEDLQTLSMFEQYSTLLREMLDRIQHKDEK